MISPLLTYPSDAVQRRIAVAEARSLPTEALTVLRRSLTRDLAGPETAVVPRAFVRWRIGVIDAEIARRAGG